MHDENASYAQAATERAAFLDALERDHGVPRYAHARYAVFAPHPAGRLGLKQVLASRKFFFAWLIGAGHRDRYVRIVTHLGGEASVVRSRWRAKRRGWIAAGCPRDLPPWRALAAERDLFEASRSEVALC